MGIDIITYIALDHGHIRLRFRQITNPERHLPTHEIPSTKSAFKFPGHERFKRSLKFS